VRQTQPRRTEPVANGDGTESHRHAVSSPDPASLEGVRILVVDDDEDARELIQAMLVNYGARVEAVASADEAMARIERGSPPELLISDIGLPSEDGYSLLRRVRESPAGAGLPALALTAYAGPADHRRCLEAGFEQHVSKPVEPAELATAISEVIAKARSRAARGESNGASALSLIVSNG
jgi:CheY-like chemotaxis protein